MTPRLAQDMATYNAWMNQRIYDSAGSLSDAERKQDRGAFFKSIHGTLNHLLVADKIWMGRFTGVPFPARGLDQELHRDVAALREDRERMDASISSFVATLSSRDLSGRLRYTGIVNPAPREYELWLAVTHFFNHQTHHRGQVTALLSQLGVDMGATDLIQMPEVAARNVA